MRPQLEYASSSWSPNTTAVMYQLSLVMRKPAFCICVNKDADQLRSNCAADQRLCFRYTDSTSLYYLNPKFQGSSHLMRLYSPVCVEPGRKPRRPVFSQRGSIKTWSAQDSYSEPLETTGTCT